MDPNGVFIRRIKCSPGQNITWEVEHLADLGQFGTLMSVSLGVDVFFASRGNLCLGFSFVDFLYCLWYNIRMIDVFLIQGASAHIFTI